MSAVSLTGAQVEVLRVMTRHARCVGASRTDREHGYVNTTAAKALVALGLARADTSASGVKVFVLSDAGRAAILAAA